MRDWLTTWTPVVAGVVAVAASLVKLVAWALKRGWLAREYAFRQPVAVTALLLISGCAAAVVHRPDRPLIRVSVTSGGRSTSFSARGGDSGVLNERSNAGFCGQVEDPVAQFDFRLLIGDASPYSSDWLTLRVAERRSRSSVVDGVSGDTAEFDVRLAGRRGGFSFQAESLDGTVTLERGLGRGVVHLVWSPVDALTLEFTCDRPAVVTLSP